ncbi:MAG: hypothetical protein OSJ45_05685 [Lachnospiraceae bacterium]|nr:hypothetical protein [Lachnospiraceae bacterium]
MDKIKKYLVTGIMCALFMALVPKTFTSADEGDMYSVTYNLTGVTVSPQVSQVEEGDGMDMTFTANEGYTLPEELPEGAIQIGGTYLSESDYIYQDGDLSIIDVFGDVVINVAGISESGDNNDPGSSSGDGSYSVTYDLYEVTASKQDGNVKEGTSYSVKLKANKGFKLNASNVAVQVNNEYVYSGYSYNEGVLEIDSVTGDIIIEAIATPKASSKNNNKNNNNTNNNTSDKKNNTGNKSSSNNSSSKSSQAMASSGRTATNYSTSSYRAPRTGDGMDIRYYGAFALIFLGAGCLLAGKKFK